MAIFFISGKPGGGKSYYAVKLIVEELLYGSRPVYTNLPLHVGRLNEFVQSQTSRDCEVVQRVRLLSEDETSRFYAFRPDGFGLPPLTAQDWSAGRRPQYVGVKDHGVFYVIDEVHNFFNARAWAETGRDVLFYLSQHRKLGDSVVCVTQALNNVDKQFRSVAQDFTFVRNLRKEKMGVFKLPPVFIRKTFGSPPTETSVAMESGTFRLDCKGIGSCYDTAQGVGIHGRGADLGERKKGLPWWVFVVGIPALLFSIVHWGPKLIADQFVSMTGLKRATVVITNSVSAAGSPGGPGPVVPAGVRVMRPVSSGPSGRVVESSGVFLQSVDSFGPGGRVRVMLSDGEVFYVGDGRLQVVTSRYAVVDGVTNWVRPAVVPVASLPGAFGGGGGTVEGPARNKVVRFQ
jgi:hypothetical protein